MVQTQIFYIATSKVKEIRKGASVSFEWGSKGPWTKFKSPVASSLKKVAYNKKTKNKIGSSRYGGAGGVTKLGTYIPATAERTIAGVSRTCDVRYYQRGYTIYNRTSALKSQHKMQKVAYTSTKPYQYRLQYKDKAVLDAEYSEYIDGMEYIFFAEKYWGLNENDEEVEIDSPGCIRHPSSCSLSYSDCRRNFTSNANNNDNRDNKGSYVLSNVRANIVTMSLEWTGLDENEGIDLLNTLNPTKDTSGNYPYLIVQYLDPTTGAYKNGTFFAGERAVEKYPNGKFKKISVTLTEV